MTLTEKCQALAVLAEQADGHPLRNLKLHDLLGCVENIRKDIEAELRKQHEEDVRLLGLDEPKIYKGGPSL